MENRLLSLTEATDSPALFLKEGIDAWIIIANDIIDNIITKIESKHLSKLSYLLLQVLQPLKGQQQQPLFVKLYHRALEMFYKLFLLIPKYPSLIMNLPINDKKIEWDFPSTIQHHIKKKTFPQIFIKILYFLLKMDKIQCHNWFLLSSIDGKSSILSFILQDIINTSSPTLDDLTYLNELWNTDSIVISYAPNICQYSSPNTTISYPLECDLINFLLKILTSRPLFLEELELIFLFRLLSQMIIHRQPAITSPIQLNQLSFYCTSYITNPLTPLSIKVEVKRIIMEIDLLIRPRYPYLLPPSISKKDIKYIVSVDDDIVDDVYAEKHNDVTINKHIDVFDDKHNDVTINKHIDVTINKHNDVTINNYNDVTINNYNDVTINNHTENSSSNESEPDSFIIKKSEPKVKLLKTMIDEIEGSSEDELPDLHL